MGLSGFAPVPPVMNGRDGARAALCPTVSLVTRGFFGGQVMFYFLFVLSGVKEQTESSHAVA